MFMASKSMRVLNIVSGVLLIVVGIYCLCNQDIAVETVSYTHLDVYKRQLQ